MSNGRTSGTVGQSKRLEAIQINLTGSAAAKYDVYYRVHSQNARQVEAIQIKLTGSDANNYDVFYRVHSQNFGWLGWAKNGESAGTAGYAYRMESIQIKVLPKNYATAPSTGGAYSVKTYNVNSGATGVDVSYKTLAGWAGLKMARVPGQLATPIAWNPSKSRYYLKTMPPHPPQVEPTLLKPTM